MSCTVCNHPERQAIDLALLNRTATLAQLSAKHQLSQSALHRHKQHLLKKMGETQNRFQEMLREGSLFILNTFLNAVMDVAQTAGAEGDTRLTLQAVRQGTAIIKFMHKQDVPLSPDTVYRLLESPQWLEQQSLLPTTLEILVESRLDLADSLIEPCPEPASGQDHALDADQGDGAALEDIADLNPEMLQNLLTDLSQSLGLAGLNPPPPQREKGGKKPKKAPGLNHNHKQYQEDIFGGKNSGKNPETRTGCLRQPETAKQNLGLETQNSELVTPAWVKALDEGRLDINTLHAIGAGRPIDLDLTGCSIPA